MSALHSFKKKKKANLEGFIHYSSFLHCIKPNMQLSLTMDTECCIGEFIKKQTNYRLLECSVEGKNWLQFKILP